MAMEPVPLRSERTTAEPASWSAVPILTLALEALSERVLLWAVTLGAGGIWFYAVTKPDILRIIAASLYSLTVLWPVLWTRRGGG